MTDYDKKIADEAIGHLYAVRAGDYVGQMLAVVEYDEDSRTLGCFQFPAMCVHRVPMDSFKEGIEHTLLDKIDKIEGVPLEEIKHQYERTNQQTVEGSNPITTAELYRSS